MLSKDLIALEFGGTQRSLALLLHTLGMHEVGEQITENTNVSIFF